MLMQKIYSLISKLKNDFPDIKFVETDDFKWNAKESTVYFDPKNKNSPILTLHEVSHSILKHEDYIADVDLIRMESDAWNLVKTSLSKKYGIKYSDNLAEDNLDSYREWLHKRSTCPNCTYNGWQTSKNSYKCPFCLSVWKVNSHRLFRPYRQKEKHTK